MFVVSGVPKLSLQGQCGIREMRMENVVGETNSDIVGCTGYSIRRAHFLTLGTFVISDERDGIGVDRFSVSFEELNLVPKALKSHTSHKHELIIGANQRQQINPDIKKSSPTERL